MNRRATLVLAVGLLLGGSGFAVPEAAAAAPPTLLVRQEQVALVPQADGWHVLDLMTIVNDGSATLTRATAWAPPELTDLKTRGGLTGISSTPDGTLRLNVRLRPGRPTQVGFSYRLPGRDLDVAWYVPEPVLELVFLVPRNRADLSGPDFRFAGSQRVGPLTMAGYLAAAPTAGSVLHLRITRPDWLSRLPLGPIAATAAAVLILAALALYLRRRRRVLAVVNPEALVGEIAALDAAFQRRELDAKTYGERRQALLERLVGLPAEAAGSVEGVAYDGPYGAARDSDEKLTR